MGPLELDGAQMKSQLAPRQLEALNQEQMGLFDDHGATEARWALGQELIVP